MAKSKNKKYGANVTQKEHYVSQFYLEEFDKESEPLKQVSLKEDPDDKTKPKIINQASADSICYKRFFYETPWLPEQQEKFGEFVALNDLEHFFGSLETKYRPLRDKINKLCLNPNNKHALICTKEDKELLADFVANFYLRNPSVVNSPEFQDISDIRENPICVAIQELFNWLEFGSIEPMLIEGNKRAWLRNDMENSGHNCFKQQLLNKHVTFLVSEKGLFVTSNIPVVVDSSEEDCVFFVLSPHVAVLYTYKWPSNRAVFLEEKHVMIFNSLYTMNKPEMVTLYGTERNLIKTLKHINYQFKIADNKNKKIIST